MAIEEGVVPLLVCTTKINLVDAPWRFDGGADAWGT